MRTSRAPRPIVSVVLACALALAVCAPGMAAAAVDQLTTSSASSPVLVVRSFTTEPADVLLGQRFTLTLTIRNETKPTAKDVVVSLGGTAAGTSSDSGGNAAAAGADLVSLDASDVRFVGTLKGGASTTVSFNLISSPRASAGVFSLPVNISSEVSGARVTSSQNIGLIVGRVATFSEQNVEFPDSGVVGKSFPISLDVMNTATYAIPGVTLYLEGDAFTLKDTSVVIGTIEAGDAGTLEVSVTPKKAGDATLTVVASYRDDFGAVREVRFPHQVKVEGEPKADEEKPGEADEKPTGVLASIVAFFRGLLGLGG